MAAHRYWRIANILAANSRAVELTELQLLDGVTRVDAGSTFTSNVAPTSGVLANLQDGSPGLSVRWDVAADLRFDWDLGSAVEVNNFRMGSGANASMFPSTLSLLWSDDGVTYSVHRQGDYYSFPGSHSMTPNVTNGVVVRSAGPLLSQNAAATLAAVPPPRVEIGDLLVTALARVGATTPPSGWTLVDSAGPTGSFNQICEVWVKVATEADKAAASWSWTNVTNIQVFALAAGIRPPLVESHANVSDNLNVGARALPVLTAAGDKRLALSSSFWTLAFVGGSSTDMSIVPSPPWVRHFSAQPELRLGNATAPLEAGGTTAGTVSTNATGTGGGWAIVVAIFSAPLAIQSSAFALRGMQNPVRVLPLQPAPPQADFGRLRSIHLARLRKDFYSIQRGLGIGRINGTTKDKATVNIPVSERVVLFRMLDGLPMRTTISTPGTGAYSFDYIDETEIYFVVAFDHNGTFRAVIADNLVPDLIA